MSKTKKKPPAKKKSPVVVRHHPVRDRSRERRPTAEPRERVVQEVAPGIFVRDQDNGGRGRQHRVSFDITAEQLARKEGLGMRVAWGPTLRAAFDGILSELEAQLGDRDRARTSRRAREATLKKNGKTSYMQRWRAEDEKKRRRGGGTRAAVGGP